MKQKKHSFKLVITMMVALSMVLTFFTPMTKSRVKAATSYSFDFGSGGTASGYTGVSASTSYSSSRGYGFNSTSNMANVSAAGSGALSDAVQFKSTSTSNTFNVDLDNGLYQVTVYLGNTNRTSVWAEGCIQIVNMTGNNAYATFQLPITDGQLNIMATAGKAGYAYTMSSLVVNRISSSTTMKPTIWLCGDSTVCNYYPLSSSTQAGWGQVLDQYVNTSTWQIRNMAASGEYAQGFIDHGLFAAINKYGKSGDIFFISIGINDTNYSNTTEYYNAVKSMATTAKNKGMKVILVKQQGRATDVSRSPLLTGRWFGSTLDTIGSELGIQVVDLFTLAQNYWVSIGQTATTALFMAGDTLHPNRNGAKVLANLVAGQVNFSTSSGGTSSYTIADGWYYIKNLNSQKYLQATNNTGANGQNVEIGSGSGAAGQRWYVTNTGNGYFTLKNGTGYMLDVYNGVNANGTNIQLYSNNNLDPQKFTVSASSSSGYYGILSKIATDKGLDCASKGTADGTNVLLYTYSDKSNQVWKFEATQAPN